jgi:hypothetical protein
VTIHGVSDDGDLSGSLARITAAPAAPARRTRRLPVAATIGSFGR